MSTYRDSAHLQDALSDLCDFLRQIGRNITTLDQLIYDEERARGLPKPGSGGTSHTITDEERDDGPCPRSDPVGEEAIQDRALLASLKGARRQAEADVVAIRRQILALDGRVLDLIKPPEKPPGVKPIDEIWCDNCKQYGTNSPRRPEGGKVCRWCADFRRNHTRATDNSHQLPTRPLVDRHAQGHNPTSKDLAAAGFREVPEQVPA